MCDSRNGCSATHASVCTVARRKCGKGLESGHLFVTCFCRSPEGKTPAGNGQNCQRSLGTPLGHPEFVATHLEHTAEEYTGCCWNEYRKQFRVQLACMVVPLRSSSGELCVACGAACVAEASQRTVTQGCGDVWHIQKDQCEATARPPAQCPWCWASWGDDCLHGSPEAP